MTNLPAKKPVDILKNIVNSESIQTRLNNALGEQAGLFTLSLIDVYSSDTYLQKCDPGAVVAEAMKAAALRLPITKTLGFAYIVPYGNAPQFQIGYKGMIQLAMRTGQFKALNADAVYTGETVKTNRLTGSVEIGGTATSDKAIGYFCYMELINGFSKTIYWEHDQVISHAKKFSKSFKSKNSAWTTDTVSMCIKTVVRQLLSKWAPMSIDFIGSDSDGDEPETEEKPIEVDFEEVKDEKPEQEKKAESTEDLPY